MPEAVSDRVGQRQFAEAKGFRVEFTGGLAVRIVAADVQSAAIVARIQAAMRLEPDVAVSGRTVVVSSEKIPSVPGADDQMLVVPRCQGSPAITPALQLIHVSLAVCLWSQDRGGVLLHGALAERDGLGVVLAGPGGVGKTTASRRLAQPWSSLSDDATLVVRDAQGQYWAHPWPTWSRFVSDGPGGSWDVQHSVRLRGIFFLARAERDQAEPVGAGHAVTLLVESAEQAWWGMSPHLSLEEQRASRLQRLDNICALAKAVPTYSLSFSSTGEFWREIERVLADTETA